MAKTLQSLTRRTLLLAAASLAAPHVARAAVRTIRIGHNNADSSHFGEGSRDFAAAVKADPALAPVLAIEVHGNGELGDDMSMLASCVKGTLDGMLCGSSIISNVVPEIGLLNAPYLFRDAARARSALDGPLGAELKELANAKNLPVLAWGENGVRHISSNRPIKTAADLKGLKIRVPQSEIMLAGFRAMGADAAPLSFALLREALRTGEFQAQENAATLVEASKLYEVQKYLSLTGHIYDAIGFILSADLLEDLTEPQRLALTRCAQAGAVTTRKVSAAAQDVVIPQLRAHGMTVLEDVDVDSFRTASRPFLESLKAKFGADRITRLMTAGA